MVELNACAAVNEYVNRRHVEAATAVTLLLWYSRSLCSYMADVPRGKTVQLCGCLPISSAAVFGGCAGFGVCFRVVKSAVQGLVYALHCTLS
jgi:hypothetical protein